MIPYFTSVATLKLAHVTAGTLVFAIGGWGVTVLAQIEQSDPIATAIPAAALTATSGALVWVVKQIAGGNLVHRDPAHFESKLTEISSQLSTLTELSHKREATLHNLLMARMAENQQPKPPYDRLGEP